jgi:hypothetical protein
MGSVSRGSLSCSGSSGFVQGRREGGGVGTGYGSSNEVWYTDLNSNHPSFPCGYLSVIASYGWDYERNPKYMRMRIHDMLWEQVHPIGGMKWKI